MTARRIRRADRPVSILLATLYAPIASLLVNAIGHLLVGDLAMLERMMAHPAMATVLSFVGAIWHEPKWMTLHACVIAWLGVVPAMMFLRAIGWLRLWTALPAGAIFPLSTVSAVTLFMWQSTSAATSEKLIVYGMLVAMTVPAAMAAAGMFWAVNALESAPKPGMSSAIVPRESDRTVP